MLPIPVLLGLSIAGGWEIPVRENLDRLLAEQDKDNDKKITVEDRGSGRFVLAGHAVEGTYALSILLQELKLAEEAGKDTVSLAPEVLAENPVDRTSRLIRERFWDGLTRSIDAEGLARIGADPKAASADGRLHVYVPHSDARALAYFTGLKAPKLAVERLPERITPEYVRSLDGRHGILTLALTEGPSPRGVPFVVPGGRFNEMYGWDSYFIALGLLADDRADLAKDMVDNHVYQMRHYGRILNANRSYYLTRSQPPFLSSMLRAVHARLPDRAWLEQGLKAVIQEYDTVWTAPPRLVKTHGLSRYYDDGTGPCPEVEPGHYDYVVAPFAKAKGVSVDEYLKGTPDPWLAAFFVHDRAVRESGHDTTYRFDGRTTDFLTVDLNALLYKVETDVAAMLEELGRKAEAAPWRERARLRRERVDALLWDEERGMYFDYDMKNKRRSGYVSATTFYPLWAGMASDAQALTVARAALPELERLGGLAATSLGARGDLSGSRPQRQWDYPFGWAPHQILAWEGLMRHGLRDDAQRLAYRWLWAIAKNARDYNGTVPEKLDVEKASHKVFAEYGNVGTEFAYITKEGFGWMNASFQLGLGLLDAPLKQTLRRLSPPDQVFPSR